MRALHTLPLAGLRGGTYSSVRKPLGPVFDAHVHVIDAATVAVACLCVTQLELCSIRAFRSHRHEVLKHLLGYIL